MATRINVEIDAEKLKQLVMEYLSDMVAAGLSASDVKIETRSKQNFKSEWEVAEFRAVISKSIT